MADPENMEELLRYVERERAAAYDQADPKVSKHDSRVSRARAEAMGDVMRRLRPLVAKARVI